MITPHASFEDLAEAVHECRRVHQLLRRLQQALPPNIPDDPFDILRDAISSQRRLLAKKSPRNSLSRSSTADSPADPTPNARHKLQSDSVSIGRATESDLRRASSALRTAAGLAGTAPGQRPKYFRSLVPIYEALLPILAPTIVGEMALRARARSGRSSPFLTAQRRLFGIGTRTRLKSKPCPSCGKPVYEAPPLSLISTS